MTITAEALADHETMTELQFQTAITARRRDFRSVHFHGPVELAAPHGEKLCVESLDFRGAVFHDDINLSGIQVTSNLALSDCVARARVHLSCVTAARLSAERLNAAGRFSLLNSTVDVLHLSGSRLHDGLFCRGLSTRGRTDLSDLRVDKVFKLIDCELTRLNTDGTTLPDEWDDSWLAGTFVREALQAQVGENTLVW